MKKQQKLRPHLKQKDVEVYRDALEKHSWDVDEAFNELSLKRLVNARNRKQRCQIVTNFEIIKNLYEPICATQSNTTLAVVQASSTILAVEGGKEEENLQSGMVEAGFCERHVLTEEIDALLSPEQRAFVYHELRTMISNLGSKLKRFLPASQPDTENSQVKGIQILNADTRLVGPEAKFKWSHFQTALKVIQEMFCRAPSIEVVDEVDYIVSKKIVYGPYDYLHDESVVKFVESVLQYTQLVRKLFSNEHQAHKEQLSNEIESQIEFMKKLLEAEMSKIEENVKFLAKAGSRADTRLSLLKRDLEKTIEQKKHLECELANLVTKLNELNSDLERCQKEKNDMATEQNEIEQFVHSTLDEYHSNARKVEEKLRTRLGNLDDMYKRELERLKMVVLRSSIQNPVTSPGSRMNPVLVKEEYDLVVQVKKE